MAAARYNRTPSIPRAILRCRRGSKKLTEAVAAACLKNEDGYPVRLLFQDEARFGRISDSRACWAPAPQRPLVNLALVREFRYEYAAVSPWDGCLDFMTAEKMNTENMSRFLDQVSKGNQDQFIIMV